MKVTGRKLILIGVVLIVLAAAGGFILQFSWANFEVGTIPQNATATLQKEGSDQITILKPGKKLLQTGSYIVRIKSGSGETFAQYKVRPLRTTRMAPGFSAKKAVAKVSSETGQNSCGLADKVASDYYVYRCNGQTNIFDYVYDSATGNRKVQSGASFYNLTPFTDTAGAIGFVFPQTSVEKTGLVYTTGSSFFRFDYKIDPSESLDIYKLWPLSGSSFIVADTKNKTLTYFKNTAQRSGITLEIDLGENIDYKHVVVEGNKNTLFITTKEPVGEGSENFKNGLLYSFNITGSDITPSKKIKLPDDITSESSDLHVFGDNMARLSTKDQLVIDDLKNGIDEVTRVDGVSDILVHASELYFIKEGMIYRFDTQSLSSSLVFSSVRWRVSSLANLGSELGFFAYPQASPNPDSSLFAVRSGNASQSALEDILPYVDTTLAVRSLDFNNTTIYVKLLLESFETNRETNTVSYSTQEYNDKKNAVTKSLSQLGISSPQYAIVFSY